MSAVLSREEAARLLALAQQGDEDAQAELVEKNLALVKSIVRKFLGRGAEFEDLYQIGCVGLVKAIRNFNSGYGVQFSTYAVPMIAGEIKRFLRDDGLVKVSRPLKELAARAAAAEETLRRTLGREPTIGEVAKAAGAPPEEVVFARDAARGCVSLSEPLYEEEGASLIDRIPAKEETGAVIDRLLLQELLSELEPRERQIILLRYFKDQTQSQIAAVLGVSQVQVSRLESRILQKMRRRAQ